MLTRQIEDEYAELLASVENKRDVNAEMNQKLLEEKARFEKELHAFIHSLSGLSFEGIPKA